jgi:RimJ/RimL family protein N-acetyltransferase
MSGAARDWKPGAPVLLQTERFLLRSMTRLQAWRATYPWTSDAEIMNPLGYPAGTWTRYSWYKRLKRFNNRRRFFLAIQPRGNPAMIGFEMVDVSPAGSAFLTVAIADRTWWGRGVVREARGAVIDFLFDWVGCHRVWGTPRARNFASIFNYQSLGFTHEGVLRQNSVDQATRLRADDVIFGLLREEWLARRATGEPAGTAPARQGSMSHKLPAAADSSGAVPAGAKPEGQ